MTVIVEKNVDIPLRDGVRLRADVYRPNDGGRHPVLLQRTPYNKELWPITAMTLDPVRAAAAGFAVVIQDVRSRWASEGGVFFPYVHERDDGHDSIAWCAAQAWSSGRVGCYGLSYMGGTSWLAALSRHPALGAISPTTAPNDFWRNHFWRGGALNLGTLAMWALRAIGPAALIRARPEPASFGPPLVQLIDDIDAFGDILAALPLERFAPAHPEADDFVPFFYEFLRHPAPDDWTGSVLFSDRHAEVTVPSLSIAGWHDLLLMGDLEHFAGMRANAGSEQARRHSRLVIGPWSHGMFGNVVGEVDFGFRANGLFLDLKEDLTKLQLRWFDRWLNEAANGCEDEAPVRYFVQGPNRWREASDWPPPNRPTSWYLHAGGCLAPQAPATGAGADSYVYDPAEPCPTRGGNTLLPPQYPAGPVDQREVAARRDVLVYTSAPLARDLEIAGAVSFELVAATSGPDTDWMVKLCDVHPDGRIVNLCDGVVRASLRDGRQRCLLEPGAVTTYTLDLWATAAVFRAGHRLAVLVTSSDFPRYDRNPNTGELAHTATRFEPALQRVFREAGRASRLILPVVDGA
ncbi:MAG: CocE/NonD family hydrolase [Gammaproteobacteria bacterium]|nr:CocE/NonD family hydrolase [Gammaproteobacteria bacterium]MCP5198816.1 CocE/NonD family hydrolase [Gammaproteobacteria bacterium]